MVDTAEFERDLLGRIVQNIKPSKAAIFSGQNYQMSVSHGVETDQDELNLELVEKVVQTEGPVSDKVHKRQLAVPYKNIDGKVLGVMYVEIAAPRRLKFRDLAILQGLGRQMVERHSQRSENSESSLHPETMGEVTRYVRSTLSIVSSVLKPQRVLIIVRFEDGPRIVASRGFDDVRDLSEVPFSRELVDSIWEKGETSHIRDALNDPQYSKFAGVKEHSLRSVCVCPLNKLDGEDRGLIYLDSCKDPAEFLTAEVSILQRLALALEKDLARVLAPGPETGAGDVLGSSSSSTLDNDHEYSLPEVSSYLDEPDSFVVTDSDSEEPKPPPEAKSGSDEFQATDLFEEEAEEPVEAPAVARETAETVGADEPGGRPVEGAEELGQDSEQTFEDRESVEQAFEDEQEEGLERGPESEPTVEHGEPAPPPHLDLNDGSPLEGGAEFQYEPSENDLVTITLPPQVLDEDEAGTEELEPTVEETAPSFHEEDGEVESVRALPVDATVEVSAEIAARALAGVRALQEQQEARKSEEDEQESEDDVSHVGKSEQGDQAEESAAEEAEEEGLDDDSLSHVGKSEAESEAIDEAEESAADKNADDQGAEESEDQEELKDDASQVGKSEQVDQAAESAADEDADDQETEEEEEEEEEEESSEESEEAEEELKKEAPQETDTTPASQPAAAAAKPPAEVTEQEESLLKYVERGLQGVTPAKNASFWERLKWVFSPQSIPQGGNYSHIHIAGKVVLQDNDWKGDEPIEVTLNFPSHKMTVILEIAKGESDYAYHGRFEGESPVWFEVTVEKPGYFPIKLSKVTFRAGELDGQGEPTTRVHEITLIPRKD